MEADCFRYGVVAKIALRRLDPFEALAEISDFAAGLVQRVPKKMNEVKSDLQNSTARLWNLEGSATRMNWN